MREHICVELFRVIRKTLSPASSCDCAIFTGQKGPLHRWALNRMFVDFLEKTSKARVARGLLPIPRGCFRFHTLKHSVATILANRVQNIFTLKNHLGHASISSLMSYAHPDPRTTAAQVQQALSIAFSGF